MIRSHLFRFPQYPLKIPPHVRSLRTVGSFRTPEYNAQDGVSKTIWRSYWFASRAFSYPRPSTTELVDYLVRNRTHDSAYSRSLLVLSMKLSAQEGVWPQQQITSVQHDKFEQLFMILTILVLVRAEPIHLLNVARKVEKDKISGRS